MTEGKKQHALIHLHCVVCVFVCVHAAGRVPAEREEQGAGGGADAADAGRARGVAYPIPREERGGSGGRAG